MTRFIKNLLVVAAIMMPFFMFYSAYADVQEQKQIFNTNETFDKFSRKSVPATLRHTGENAYFYVDDKYWDVLGFIEKDNLLSGITQLSGDFDSNIYPKETSFWGQEPKPGIDNDSRIVILLEQLKSGHGGYFSTSNGYSKDTASESNEREMIIVSVEQAAGPYAKIFLAHEFQHLISFNQKEILRKLNEDVWLNELRSEYAITLVGYNDSFDNSNLERRAKTFFGNSSDSLTEWPNVSLDYSLVAFFGEYIIEELGKSFLRETLQNSLVGISSFNNVLAGRGAKERFIDIFSGWLAASYINNESISSQLGYARLDLKNLKAIPQRLTILSDSTPSTGSGQADSSQAGSESNIFDYSLKPWQVYGHKFLISGVLSGGKIIKLSPSYNSKFAYADNLGRFSIVDRNFYVTDPGNLQYFFIFPINDKKVSDFGTQENESFLTLTVVFEEKALGVDFGSTLKAGVLIKKRNGSEIYVIEGKYKRYLKPEIIALYGHLDTAQAIEVDETTFHLYVTANYVKNVNDQKVYAVWPDGTKHWLNMTGDYFTQSGRDWNAVFTINDLELNYYKVGQNITR